MATKLYYINFFPIVVVGCLVVVRDGAFLLQLFAWQHFMLIAEVNETIPESKSQLSKQPCMSTFKSFTLPTRSLIVNQFKKAFV